MDQPVVEVKNLKKFFKSKNGPVKAVNGVNLKVFAGEVFGFLGPNGAGKTTTLRMLTTLMPPDSGSAVVAGYDVKNNPDQVRRRIGYVSQAGGADRPATGRENLVLQGQLYGMTTNDALARAEELIKLLDLTEFAGRTVYTYSGGQRRRLDVALGLMNHPTVLFLDEPTTGLDPQNRANLWVQIEKLKHEGTTIFLTTHYLEEADALCDRLAIMDNGQIVAEGTPEALKKQVAGDCITISIGNQKEEAPGLVEAFKKADYMCEVKIDENYLRLYVKDGAKAIAEVLKLLEVRKIKLLTITLSSPSLDDVFLRQTGHSLRDTNAEGGDK
jgi:ABC-2 type transport system ATP-binding protein